MDKESDKVVRNIKSSLLGWYSFRDSAHILYIGKTDDDWARGIHCAGCRVEFMTADEVLTEDIAERFDYVVLVEIIECTENALELLTRIRRILQEGGVLLLGVNNRLGIRYFCGDRDKYTGRNFDGIENYKRIYSKSEDSFMGRMYSKAEIENMLASVRFNHRKFYSVFPNLDNPMFLFAEGYYPNEDLCNRVFPMYENPETVFLEEESLYGSLIENNLFHQMANAYLVECPKNGIFSDIMQVTSSLDRSEENAMLTVIHGDVADLSLSHPVIVEKCPAFEVGKKRLSQLQENSRYLQEHGIRVVEATIRDGKYSMPYVNAEVGQLHLKKLLLSGDTKGFLQLMDHFRDLILKSSDILLPDKGDGEGAILSKGFLDLVPLNSFFVDGDFTFFDQEFVEDNYPANVLIFRMIATFYYENRECENILPREVLFDRYNLTKKVERWKKMEWEFLDELRNANALREYNEKHRRDWRLVNGNRQRMNYSQERYEKLFVNIFEHADTRKLILFGSGNFTKKFISIYGEDYPIYGVIDNNPAKWGTKIDGIKISSPEILKEFMPGEYKVLICIKNYISVMKQLEEMGVGDFSIYDGERNYPRKLRAITNVSVNGNGNTNDTGTKKKYHIGYVAGAFDMFHVGHLNLLCKAKELCNYLIVGVMADETIYEKKSKKPIVPLEDRLAVVAACRYVDQAAPLPVHYNSIIDAYHMFHFDVQFSGNDHADNEDWLKDKEYLNRNGADIVFFNYTEKVSSTMLRQQIDKRCD